FSLSNVEGATQNNNDFVVGPIYKNIPRNHWKPFTDANALIRGQLISADYKTVIVLAEPKKKLSPGQLNTISAKISHIAKKRAPGSKLQIGGVPAIQAQFSTQLFGELKIYLTASIIGFGLMFFAFLGGASSIIFAFLTLLAGNILCLGLLAYMQVPFSVLLTTLPIVLSISILSVLIHTMHRWAEVLIEAGPQITAQERFLLSLRTLKEMFVSNLLGALTTTIGFFALWFAKIPLIEQYGWVVALFVMLGWAMAQILLLAYMQLTQPMLRTWTTKKSTWMLFILKHKGAVLASVAVIFATCLYIGQGLQFNGRLFDDLPDNDPVRQATQLIDKKMGGAVSYEIVLNARKDEYWKTRNNLIRLDTALKRLRKIKGVGSAVSYSDFFTKNKKLTQQKIGEEFFLFSLAEKNPLKNYVTDNSRSARVAIRLNDLPSHDMAKVRRKITGRLRAEFKDVRVIEAGIAVNSHAINQSVSKDLVFNFWHALVLVGLLLLVVFRSMRWAIVACLPNLIPPAILIGAMAFFETPIKPGVALIFSIALGLAFNNTVYILVRLQKIIKEKNLFHHLPIKRTMLQEGNPCLFETMIMLVGFSFFILSNFSANRIFGMYMVLSIVAGALGDIFFLPALLQKFPGLLKPFKSRTEIEPATLHDLQNYNDTELEKSSAGKVVASLATALAVGALVFATPVRAFATPHSVQDVLKEVQKRIEAKDDEAKVKMKIIEANGEIKERVMHIQTLNNGKFHALVRLEAPADIKGMAFLAIVDKEDENQWLYIPSAKQVRRLVGTQKSAGVLGSELTMDDLNSTAIKTAKTRIIKEDGKEIQIEVVPRKGTSAYAKAITTISAKEFVPLKTEYFAKNGKLKKRVIFSKYKKVKGFWRAHLIKVENLLNKRKTNLELSQVKVNNGFSEDDFSQTSLKP
ncbi:MAG: outer membrane lipoprotein-sorting protein, partial [Bdellovibrionota bacterium]